jgi:hypothetical protein
VVRARERGAVGAGHSAEDRGRIPIRIHVLRWVPGRWGTRHASCSITRPAMCSSSVWIRAARARERRGMRREPCTLETQKMQPWNKPPHCVLVLMRVGRWEPICASAIWILALHRETGRALPHAGRRMRRGPFPVWTVQICADDGICTPYRVDLVPMHRVERQATPNHGAYRRYCRRRSRGCWHCHRHCRRRAPGR